MRVYPDSSITAGLVARIEAMNTLAEWSEGFVWRQSGTEVSGYPKRYAGPVHVFSLTHCVSRRRRPQASVGTRIELAAISVISPAT
ncbi:MAG: hypothetical protein O3B13_14430, partial [Planctomycetota bacterium]|nr:hypothetical protein [Planctomycetota bacterium]